MSEDGILYYNDCYSLHLSMPENAGHVPVVIILPGGAYYKLSTRYEGSEVAMWLNHRGIGAAVLHYRMPNHHPEWPQEDIARAVAYLRDNALSLHVNPHRIGIMGFSAGGHAVAMSLTRGLPVQFAVLFYPVISMDRTITHLETHNWLLYENADTAMEQLWSADLHVSPGMPHTLLIACDDDDLVPIANTRRFCAALGEMHVSCEMHILPHGGHGWGFSPAMPCPDQVQMLLAQFLQNVLNTTNMKLSINHVNWPKDFPEAPQTTVTLDYDAHFLHVRYDVTGRQLRAMATEDQQAVWEDSCVEFFCRPVGVLPYTNFECNCIGTMVATRRMGRDEDVVPFTPEQMASIVRRTSLPHAQMEERDGDFSWWVELDIPWLLITGNTQPVFPLTLECNFYKCGDLTRYPHFLSWQPVLTPTPNFHCPQYFGKIEFK